MATKTRVPVRGTIGKSVKLNVGTVTQKQLAAAIAAIPTAAPVATTVSSGGGSSGTVTSVTLAAGSSDVTLTGTNPITSSGTITIDLSAAVKAALASATTAVQPGAIQENISAGWNSSSGAITLAFTVPQDILIPYNCTLQEVYILTQGGNGSCTIKLWKTPLGSFPPTSANDITGGTPPAISAGVTYANSTLSGWTTAFSQNDVIRCTLSANSVFTSVKIILRVA